MDPPHTPPPPTPALLQYVRDVDEDLARDAIRAVAQIALKVGWGWGGGRMWPKVGGRRGSGGSQAAWGRRLVGGLVPRSAALDQPFALARDGCHSAFVQWWWWSGVPGSSWLLTWLHTCGRSPHSRG